MSRRESSYDLLPVADALELILSKSLTLTPEKCPIIDAAGKILAEDIFARDNLPPFRASILDGYALHAADGAGDYPVAMEIMAGEVPTKELLPNTLCRITTGAACPDGADAVIRVEDTLILNPKSDGKDEIVRIEKSVRSGADIRPIGSDVAVGQLVLKKGTFIRAAEVGILATVGAAEVLVYPSPVVGVLSTGDELQDPSVAELKPGHIRDSNRYMLLTALKTLGAKAVDLGVASDEASDLEHKMVDGISKVDIILTSGGVSMGELDLMKPLLEKLGTVHFGRVLMKPGKPLTFATVKREENATKSSSKESSNSSDDSKDSSSAESLPPKLIFGLPGNPVSSLVTFTLFVIPAIKKMMGYANPHHKLVQAKTTSRIVLDPQRPEYHRCTLTWSEEQQCYLAESTGRQISSRLLSMVSANGFLLIPRAEGVYEPGTSVQAMHLEL